MCGRYVTASDQLTWAEWADLFDLDMSMFEGLRLFGESGKDELLLPTSTAPVMRRGADADARLEMTTMQWGLVPSWGEGPKAGRKMFNLRSETIHSRFGSSFRTRRCVLPATAFFAYSGPRGKRVPHLVAPASGPSRLFSMAGIWATWEDPEEDAPEPFLSATILTRPSPDNLKGIHPRSPCVLTTEEVKLWLDPDASEWELRALFTSPRPSLDVQRAA